MKHALLAAMFAVAGFAAAADAPVFLKSAEPAMKAARRISSDTAARLAASGPKFVPPPAATPSVSPREPVDFRVADRPRNQIIRLPSYYVEVPKLPALPDRQVLTFRAKIDRTFKQRPGLWLGNLLGLNGAGAAAMIAEEERLERMRELDDLVSLLQFSEQPIAPDLRRIFETSFIRDPELGPLPLRRGRY